MGLGASLVPYCQFFCLVRRARWMMQRVSPVPIRIHSHAENFSDGGGAAGGELRKVGW